MEMCVLVPRIYKAMSKATIKAYKHSFNEHETIKELIKAYITVRYGTGKIITYTNAYKEMMWYKSIRFAVESLLYYIELINDGTIKKENFFELCEQFGNPDSMYINKWAQDTRLIIEDDYTI